MCHWRLSSLFITSTITTVSSATVYPLHRTTRNSLSTHIVSPADISNPSQSTSCCATRQSQAGQQNREK
ncbi:hypothetical protein M405DRAFT_820718 [Rhizopogon salebrosus TDB-379]|nr:hypothetical protein M405DRAFT_820718 [Rhizopogon salebrosus TDB-379]